MKTKNVPAFAAMPRVVAVRKIKTFKGHDGIGFNAELLLDGVVAADVVNLASGGDFEFHWVTPEARHAYKSYVDALPVPPLRADAPDWEREAWPNGMPWNEDGWVEELVCQDLEEKALKRLAKKHICFRLKNKTYTRGGWSTITLNGSNVVERRAQLERKYGEDLGEVLNDRFNV